MQMSSWSKTTADHPLLSVATVVKPHGVRGGVKVRCTEETFELLNAATTAWVGGTPRKIVRTQGIAATAIAYFEGIEDRTAAEALRGMTVEVERGELPELGEGEFYLGDLVGFDVRDAASGTSMGVVTDARQMPSSVVFEVQLAGGGLVLVPLIDEAVPEVDFDERYLTVDIVFLDLGAE